MFSTNILKKIHKENRLYIDQLKPYENLFLEFYNTVGGT